MSKEVKTLEQRIERIYRMAKEHFGEVRFVFDEFESLMAEGENAEAALKNLRKRLKKIIDRYNMV